MFRISALTGFLLLVLSAHAQDKINYTDHILPLVEANCAKCHNADKRKADLELTSSQGALKGSGSGPVVVSGNPDGSKLWRCLTHAEEPNMPPNRPKLGDKELDLFKKWILGGLLETAGGQAIAAAKPGVDLTLKPEELARPDGPPPLPQDFPLEPVVHTARGTAITGLAASPWAPLIALAGQAQVLLFHADSLELLGILPFAEGQPSEVKFSRSGRLLLASGGWAAKSGRVVVWDVVTGERLMTLGDEHDTVLAADIRPDQSQVALGGPSRLLKIVSTRTGELQQKIKKHTDWITAIAFSPNGQMLASADRNGGISIWDPESGQELFTLAGHKAGVTALSWRPDAKLLASSGEDGAVKLWEVKEGREMKNWAAHGSGALCVSYAPDGHLASCGRDQKVTLWDAKGGRVRDFEFFGNIPLRVAFDHQSARLIATDFAGRAAVWNIADAKHVGELNPNPLSIADQLAAAKKRLSELQASARVSPANSSPGEIEQLKTTIARLEAEQVLSFAYNVREDLAAKKREDQMLLAARQVTPPVTPASQGQPAAARPGTPTTLPKTTPPPTEPVERRLTAAIQSDQAKLDRLLDYYRSLLSKAERGP